MIDPIGAVDAWSCGDQGILQCGCQWAERIDHSQRKESLKPNFRDKSSWGRQCGLGCNHESGGLNWVAERDFWRWGQGTKKPGCWIDHANRCITLFYSHSSSWIVPLDRWGNGPRDIQQFAQCNMTNNFQRTWAPLTSSSGPAQSPVSQIQSSGEPAP